MSSEPGPREDPEAGGREEERACIRRAQAGDVEAFEALVRKHRNRVFWLAHQVVANAEDAKDVTQDVLVRLWKKLKDYDDRYAFSTWLYRMTMNLAIDSLRRRARHTREVELEEDLVPFEPRRPKAAGAPHQAAADAEVGRIFEELRRLLPPQQRAAFALREMEGLTSEEVAEVLGVSSSTVRNHLLQARRTLQAEMRRRYPEYLPASARGDRR